MGLNQCQQRWWKHFSPQRETENPTTTENTAPDMQKPLHLLTERTTDRQTNRQTEEKSKRAAEVPWKLLMHSSKMILEEDKDGWRENWSETDFTFPASSRVLSAIQHVDFFTLILSFLKCFALHLKYNIGHTLKKIIGEADGRFFLPWGQSCCQKSVCVPPKEQTYRGRLRRAPSRPTLMSENKEGKCQTMLRWVQMYSVFSSKHLQRVCSCRCICSCHWSLSPPCWI